MEHKIYIKKGLHKPTFIQRVIGTKIKENALIEINNLLAEKELQTVTVEDIRAIEQKYGLNFETDYDKEISGFYKAYLNSCLEDKFISDTELEDLKHLKYILGINDKDVDEIHKELAGIIYKQEVDKVIKDGELDENERIFIEKLQNDLKLPDDVAKKIYQTSGQELIKNFMNQAIADAKLTPEEEKELVAIAKNLNAELKMDDVTKSSLEKYRLYWQIENDEMPELVVDINIPRNEKCYFFVQNVIWFEQKEESKNKAGTDTGLKLKIAKGLYWRKGNDEIHKTPAQNWNKIDQGGLYLTNKRLVFKSSKEGDKIVLLNRILDFTVFHDGLELEKEGSKNVFLQFEGTADIFAMLLGKSVSQLKL